MARQQDSAGRRGRGRARRLATDRPARNVDYRRLINPFPPMTVFSDDQVAAMHHTALRLLEEVGMRVLLERARTIYRQAGATVDNESLMVRLDRGLVEQALASTPARITARAGAPECDVEFGGSAVNFTGVGGAPHATDTDRGKRPGTLDDYRNMIRLCQHYDVIHLLAACPEAQDIEPQFRHLEVTRVQLVESNKFPTVYSRGCPQVRDCFELVKRARGLDDKAFRQSVWCKTVINTNSPLTLDIPMANGIIDFAEMGQLSVITPFCLAGAMAPVTVAGALTLQHAEALAAIVLGQAITPGAPMMYGSFCSNVDMKSGSPAFGTPEHVKSLLGAGQLARHIGLAWRSAAGTAANCVDAQATYESQASLWGCIMSGSDMVMHAAGWLEGGLSASFEKFIVDVEMLQGFAELFHPVPAAEDDFAFEAIAHVGPGGHFFASPHTMERYETAFYAPTLSEWRNFGQWTEAGAPTATERANTIWKEVIAGFEAPALAPDRREAIDDYVERRRREGGAPPES